MNVLVVGLLPLLALGAFALEDTTIDDLHLPLVALAVVKPSDDVLLHDHVYTQRLPKQSDITLYH